MADDRAVARRAVVGVVGRDQHCCSGHILNHHVRFARNVFRKVTRNQSSVRIVPATRGAADDELNGFAFVEVLDRGGMRRHDPDRENNRK
jgi:hypothetical protein